MVKSSKFRFHVVLLEKTVDDQGEALLGIKDIRHCSLGANVSRNIYMET